MKAWSVALLFGISFASACKTGGTDDAGSAVKAGGAPVTAENSDRPAQLYRFDPWMDALRKAIESEGATPDSVADQIVQGPSRIAAFNLQGLCRIYGDADDMFGKMRDDFKDLEDVIGQWDKYNNVLDKAKSSNKSQAIVAKLEAKREEASQEIQRLMVDRKWVRDDGGETRLQKIQRHLDEYDWKKYKKDREDVLKYLIKELKAIDDTKYKFKHLEEGNGLHELRRDMRWVSIEMRITNGLITFEKNPQKCPSKAYQDLVNQPIAQSKYSQLPPSPTETDTCKIPQCLYLGMAEMIEEIGAIKDDVEADVNSKDDGEASDEVPAKYRDQVEKLYKKMTDNKLVGLLKDELKKCLD